MNPAMKEVMRVLEKSKLEQARGKIKKINKLKRKLNPNVKAIEAAEHDYIKFVEQFRGQIESVEDAALRDIITGYYLEGRDWTDIGDSMFMHRTTCQKKVKRYFERGVGNEQKPC